LYLKRLVEHVQVSYSN